jgi:phospholipid N-methyltransferase
MEPTAEEHVMVRVKSSKPGARSTNGMLAFIGQAIKRNQHTGAVLPSSKALARTLTGTVRAATMPKRILEVGPGTGPFTKEILKTLHTGDELHIVEINPVFAARLEKLMLEPFREQNPGVTVVMHCHPIESAPVQGTFDFIICGLPFNNFPPKIVRSIFRRLMDLLNPGGELSYFEYAGVRAMKGPLVGNKGRKNLKSIGMMGKVLRRKHAGRRKLVLGNVPPAVAVWLKR